jgi:RNA polymerase sigma-70 factor, ECF subfamily
MGDSDDFDAFYHATNRALLRQTYAMTGNLADAQDSVQEAYARAWQHWGTVRDAENPTAWVRTVAWRIFALHHLGGLSVEEVARETGAPTGTVKARLSRGRAALARAAARRAQ